MDITPQLRSIENSAQAQNSRTAAGLTRTPGAAGVGYHTSSAPVAAAAERLSQTPLNTSMFSSSGSGPVSAPAPRLISEAGSETPTATATSAVAASSSAQQDGISRPPRACEACRTLKVRCEPDAIDAGGPCKRCAKTRRECVVTAPTRKRQKKTDSRVAELERKIDVLTASLGSGHGPYDNGHGSGQSPEAAAGAGRRWLGPKQSVNGPAPTSGTGVTVGPPSMAGVKRKLSEDVKDGETGPGTEPPQPTSFLWRGSGSSSGTEPTSSASDAIDKGLVPLDKAVETFDVYVNEMAPQLPIVVFPPGTQMSDIRRTKPILFHSILAFCIGTIQPEIQDTLVDEFYKTIADRVVVKGDKSLELVQAIIIASVWYPPPERFEQLKFYQLIHMAVTLAMDIGMSRRTMMNKKPFSLKDLMGKQTCTMDLDAPETRRAWVGCYYLSVQVSAALRRVPLVRWHPYMDECIEILETSTKSLPSDKALVRWVKLAQITEEVGFQFSSDEPDSAATFSDPKVQYTVRAFEKQLEQWRRETPAEHYSLIMRQTDYLLNTYINEPTMHIEAPSGDQKDDNDHQEQPLPPAPPASAVYINALTTCLTCVHRSLDIILSLDARTLLHLPTYILGRTSYSMVALIRLYAIVTAPDSQLGQVIDPTTLHVEHYLGRAVEHYKAAGEHAGGRASAKFSVVLDLLRNWFVKQKDQIHPTLKEALGGGFGRCGHPKDIVDDAQRADSNDENGTKVFIRRLNQSNGNMGPSPATPLHLLSEVAMGQDESRNQPGSGSEANSNRSSNISPFQPPTSIDSLVSQPLPPGQQQQRQQQQQQSWLHSYSPSTPQYPSHPSAYPNQTSAPSNTVYPNSTVPTTTVPAASTAANQFFMPETTLPVGVGFEPENLFTLNDIFGDGFFGFPGTAVEGLWQ